MAICRCGNEDTTLPDTWTNWECPKCFAELLGLTHPRLVQMEMSAKHKRDLRDKLNEEVIDLELEIAISRVECSRIVKTR